MCKFWILSKFWWHRISTMRVAKEWIGLRTDEIYVRVQTGKSEPGSNLKSPERRKKMQTESIEYIAPYWKSLIFTSRWYLRFLSAPSNFSKLLDVRKENYHGVVTRWWNMFDYRFSSFNANTWIFWFNILWCFVEFKCNWTATNDI